MNLLRLAYDFYGKTRLPAPVVDVYLMGSIANYNWTADSDIDVHIIVDYSKLQMPPETAVKTVKTAGAQWNSEHEVTIKGFKVEMNIQNSAEQKPYVTGVYSLIKDQWVRKPFQMPLNIDRNVLKFQYSTMKQYLQNALGSGNREQMKVAKKYLDAYRQYGLDTYGELSYENIIFKILRSRGLIKQLKDSITAVYDKTMSMKEEFLDHLPEDNVPYIVVGATNMNGESISGVTTTGWDGHGNLKNRNGFFGGDCVSWRYRSENNVLYIPDIHGKGHQIPVILKYLGDTYQISNPSISIDDKEYVDLGHRVRSGQDKKDLGEVGEKDIKQTLPDIDPTRFDRDYWDKMSNETGHFRLQRLTMDELKALREKEARAVTYCQMHESPAHETLHRKMFDRYDNELKRRIKRINFPVAEGFGSGIPEKDRLKIKNTDGSTRRWQVRSKDAPKTPKMTKEEVIAIPNFDNPVKSKSMTDDHDDVVKRLEPHDDTS
jgi:hypothetical protein